MSKGYLKGYLKILAAVCGTAVLIGCGSSESVFSPEEAESTEQPADMTVSTDMSYVQTEINTVSVPEAVKAVGLGEASHGAKEYQVMKAEVFKALVENNGCRTFIIEGDFGGALKVDQYIHGGEGTAEEVVGEIGFKIYRTQEMADLVDWMRSYNESASEGADLHFYGMDMQRFDNNKEYLFTVLEQSAPELYEKYEEAFSQLTDENRNSLPADVLHKAKEDAVELAREMEAAEADIVNISGQYAFDFAKECLNTIRECCEIQMSSGADYNTLRDGFMFEKVEWYMQQGDGSILFLNGHNGHIGRTSVAGYRCLGEQLADTYGEGYFAIGTDAQITAFNSQGEDGTFSVVEVENRNMLNGQLDGEEYNSYYLDFSKAGADDGWQTVLNGKQKITTLNVGLSPWQTSSEAFYTSKITPGKTFDGMIVFREVTPTTLIP